MSAMDTILREAKELTDALDSLWRVEVLCDQPLVQRWRDALHRTRAIHAKLLDLDKLLVYLREHATKTQSDAQKPAPTRTVSLHRETHRAPGKIRGDRR